MLNLIFKLVNERLSDSKSSVSEIDTLLFICIMRESIRKTEQHPCAGMELTRQLLLIVTYAYLCDIPFDGQLRKEILLAFLR